jgi:hypothetical protein
MTPEGFTGVLPYAAMPQHLIASHITLESPIHVKALSLKLPDLNVSQYLEATAEPLKIY